jgi:hypothetical protein
LRYSRDNIKDAIWSAIKRRAPISKESRRRNKAHLAFVAAQPLVSYASVSYASARLATRII